MTLSTVLKSITAAAALSALLLTGSPPANATGMTVYVNEAGGTLIKPGLGSLFGASSINGGTQPALLSNSLTNFSASQSRIGEAPGFNPFSTQDVAPVIRNEGGRMICRFGDLCYGWAPYTWPGYSSWISQVQNATRQVSANYKDVVYAIAPFNEPDWSLNSSAFMSDTAIQGSTYDARINWLWTQTVKAIRAIDSTIPIMGPDYVKYRPWENSGADQTRMQNFLQNAISTNTVPDIIGWHSLSESAGDGTNPFPGDVTRSLTSYYRPLETSLSLPGSPKRICVEEYGPNTGDFEGVPGSMVKYWAEFARDGLDFASMGIYQNGGLLGNSLRYAWDSNPQPTSGWYMMNWYRQMTGVYVPVSSWSTRYTNAFDGVASWDSNSKTITCVLGGSDDDGDIQFTGVSALGLGSTVRVRVDMAPWDLDPNQADKTVERGGDFKTGTYNLIDANLPLDSNGNITVPIHRIEGYNGYRILITAAGSPSSYPSKYEAENAKITDATVYTGDTLASNGGYVGGINNSDSAVQFTVNVPTQGLYDMWVRYANGTTSAPATHNLTVNGVSQGAVTYPYTTTGWSTSELRTVMQRVALKAGSNTITLSKGTGYAEIDFIDVRPDTHRYEAEFATVTDATKYEFSNEIDQPNFVGGINNSDSAVSFAIEAPLTATYQLLVAYGNGTSSASTFNVTVNGGTANAVSLAPTGGWLSSSNPTQTERYAWIPVALNSGVNTVVVGKGTGYAELDYVQPVYSSTPVAGSTYHLYNVNSGLVVDDPGASTSSGVQLDQWTNGGWSDQVWTAKANSDGTWTFDNQWDGLAMEVLGSSTSTGAAVDQSTDVSGVNQHWWIKPFGDGSWKIVNANSGELLNVNGVSTANGALLSQWTDASGSNQHWVFGP